MKTDLKTQSLIKELVRMIKDETTYSDKCPCCKCVLIRKANKHINGGGK